jgi:predicted ester cyclase
VSPDELKDRARRVAQELLTQGDLAIAPELFAATCEHHAPWSLPSGPEGARRWVATLRLAFPDLRAIVEDEFVEGSTVVQCLLLGGTHDGPYLGALASGRRANWQGVEIVRMSERGVIIEHWVFWDQIGLLLQLGGEPPQPDHVAGARSQV